MLHGYSIIIAKKMSISKLTSLSSLGGFVIPPILCYTIQTSFGGHDYAPPLDLLVPKDK